MRTWLFCLFVFNFWPLNSVLRLSSPTRDRSHAPCVGRAESWPQDHHRSPRTWLSKQSQVSTQPCPNYHGFFLVLNLMTRHSTWWACSGYVDIEYSGQRTAPHPAPGTTLHAHLGKVAALCSWLVGRASEDKFREESTKARSFISPFVLDVAMRHGLTAFCSVS